MKRFRVVTVDDSPPDTSFDDACLAAMRAVLGEQPDTLTIIYTKNGVAGWHPVPMLLEVARGNIEMAHDEITSVGGDDE
ncbi:MAG: hypothetical protein P4L10_11170 [Acidobacteriaceae bacterium]|nr:hypothetical protein [Acidobacteriaceae bacterium]